MIPKRMEYTSSLEKVKSSFTRVVKPGSDSGSPLLLMSLIAGNAVLAASNAFVWQENWAAQKAALAEAEEEEPEISTEPRYGGVFTKRTSSSSTA